MAEHARSIASHVHWIQEPGPDRSHFVEDQYDEWPDWYDPDDTLHVPQNAYLITGDDSLLFDTLSPASAEIVLTELDDLLSDGLDYLVVSHPDVPHAGNAHAILEAYPEATLVAPGYGLGHELYHLADARAVKAGDRIHLGESTVEFHAAMFPDAPVHVWMSEATTGTLFPVDWLGYPHRGSQDLTFPDEFGESITVERLVQFHGRVLFWFQYVDLDRVDDAIDEVIDTHAPEIVAPGHGNPIREDPIPVMHRAKTAAARVQQTGRVGTLG